MGKRIFSHNFRACVADHPHVRGEKRARARARSVSAGSSPRAWGKGRQTRFPRRCPRIIPTCVGKRTPDGVTPGRAPDHPHVRGEKVDSHAHNPITRGSSPRAWGKGKAGHPRPFRCRIIPTCVGKSAVLQSEREDRSDHPHVRGEKMTGRRMTMTQFGSSPRAWGKEGLFADGTQDDRIIPTCVGKRCRR